MNKFYTAQEVADKLKIKKTTVYELIKRGELSSSKIGKQLRVSEDQLSLYLNGAAKNSVSAQHHDYQPESSLLKRDYLLHSSGLIISGQASPALDLLLNQLPSFWTDFSPDSRAFCSMMRCRTTTPSVSLKRAPSSSATKTERCCPPVQPTATVR